MSDEPLTFTRSSSSQFFAITIRDDTTVEDSESFVARLSVNAALYPGVRLAPDTANIHIIDNDGETTHKSKCGSINSYGQKSAWLQNGTRLYTFQKYNCNVDV